MGMGGRRSQARPPQSATPQRITLPPLQTRGPRLPSPPPQLIRQPAMPTERNDR